MRPSKRNVRRHAPAIPATWSETLQRCPFRSFIGTGGDPNEMSRRVQHAFAAIGGKPYPIADDLLDEFAHSIRSGGVVLLVAERTDLRDQAKREILARVHGAAGSA